MTTKQRRIYHTDLVKYDGDHGTCLWQHVETAAKNIVTFAPYYLNQFTTDVKLLGLDEAKMRLLRFVDKNYQSPDDLASDVVALCKLIEKIHSKLGEHFVPVSCY